MTTSAPALSKPADPQVWLLPAWPWTLRSVAISCLFAAEVGNTVRLDDRFAHWFGAGILTMVISTVEGALGVALVLRPSARAYRAAVVISFLIISVWLVGLPFGPEVGRSDALRHVNLQPTALLAVAVAALLPLAASPRLRTSAARGRGRGGSLVAATGVALFVVAFAVLAQRLGHLGAGPADAPAVHIH